ncbi:MAG: hypothetical protein A3D74_04040 [Candidatus Levybacteria bacterium RIFCSPHIGHO2_02_FULL_37_13]|nr:MAG: hypothetical protein A3D74_04040 [Candidatus Levybacteria bacterium RIFCSPHIGHO2_02_FULL_37_13]OGH30701.1 MAG: hypothetical protein A3E40_01220 [Candidatus Levybacteria bacterium RIFCSPHIGHO2_12_FULL_37_9]OGH39906.1 MAG: hypothetical protein A3B41_04120 [Candidatus Levybacteria bacterium RIFCSPLOWO2_01_FULL_37_26]
MKVFFEDVKNDKITRLGFASSFGIVLASVVFVLFYFNSLPSFIPIFNQLPWGEHRLGATNTIFLPILIAFLILLFNLFLSLVIHKRIPLVSRMLAITSLSVSFLVLFFVIRTVQLVF